MRDARSIRAREVIALALLAVSCGGRSYEVLLDSEEQSGAAVGATGAGAGGGGAPVTTTTDASAAVGSGGGDVGGAGTGATGSGSGGSGEGGGGGGQPSPVDCFLCIGQSCPEVATCLQDPTCSQGLFCTFTSCLSGGMPDIACVADCFGGDFGAALQALQSIGCVFQACGDSCGGLIPLPGG